MRFVFGGMKEQRKRKADKSLNVMNASGMAAMFLQIETISSLPLPSTHRNKTLMKLSEYKIHHNNYAASHGMVTILSN